MFVKEVAWDTGRTKALSIMPNNAANMLHETLTLPMNAIHCSVCRNLAEVNHKVAHRAKEVVLVDVPVGISGIVRVGIWNSKSET
jgi:hypothetical protein